MAVSAPVRQMSVEEFLLMESPIGDFVYELHDGELARVTRPKKGHHMMQDQLVQNCGLIWRSSALFRWRFLSSRSVSVI